MSAARTSSFRRTASASSSRSPGQSTWRPPPLKTPARRAVSAELTAPSRPAGPLAGQAGCSGLPRPRPGRPFAVGCSPNRYAYAMGLLDDAIREHLDLKRARGGDPAEIERMEREALGPVRREPTIGSARFDTVEEVAPHAFQESEFDEEHLTELEELQELGYHDSTAPHPHLTRRAWASASRACRAGPGLRARSRRAPRARAGGDRAAQAQVPAP